MRFVVLTALLLGAVAVHAQPQLSIKAEIPFWACQISSDLRQISVPVAETTVQTGERQFARVGTGLHEREIFAGEARLLGNGLLSQVGLTVDAEAGRLLLENDPAIIN